MIVGDESMTQVEKSPLEKAKGALVVEEEVGHIKSLEKSMGEMLKDVGGATGGEIMSGIHLRIHNVIEIIGMVFGSCPFHNDPQ